MLLYNYLLLSAEDTVARIAHTGNDVVVFVQSLVLDTAVDVDIGVSLQKLVQSLGRSDDTHELDVLNAVLLYLCDSLYRGRTCSQHRIHNDNISLGDIIGKLAVVLNGLLSL